MTYKGETSTAAAHNMASTWGKYLTDIPPFSVVKIVIYKRKSGKSRGITRGYKFFVENYIHKAYVKTDHGLFHVKCLCFRSQKKRERPHSVEVRLNISTGSVAFGICSCTAGYVFFQYYM